MSSPPLSSSPRRESDDFSRPRLSPTLARTLDPNDPQVMERQRTMDVDMAMQLSRARRETSIPSPSSSPPKDDPVFTSISPLSLQEQRAIDIARGEAVQHDEADLDSLLTKRPSVVDLHTHLHQTHDPSLLAGPRVLDDPSSAFATFNQSPYRSEFDFGPSDAFRSTRQRKFSQSDTTPRIHRKGIGGKLALFEGSTGEQPPIGPNLSTVHSVNDLTSQSVPVLGIPSTGHGRPYRFSFYSNALSATIHARSLSELPAEGQTFEDLFSGVQVVATPELKPRDNRHSNILDPTKRSASPAPLDSGRMKPGSYFSKPLTSQESRSRMISGMIGGGDPEGTTWWLDILNPTDDEMKMLSKVFSIHPLTTEDIQMEETREKIELFRNYYLVCFRSFEQDPYSPTHLEPLNMYIIVFREGILSFHFRPTPHPQNVRRRIKQLKDYISVTSDWISYALIDDITDAFGPLIQTIEYEVDSIDELVLILKEAEQSDMLRRIGRCRKKVMGLLRLMGNKADVVKGLAKRCNENWHVAPTSDIGLYLSDIQDHLITMTQNLNHYEKILSRSHSNYLAQISIEMTDANNQINDVLSKLTALGTVLIPMNLVTGLWGMNVHVPGQNVEV
ncbi:hypothetical protein C8J56DRAFT_935610 [Mycena floridula]|nr:hypothetical protein C8J56DRAFT_935610 [Mycena floridula]